MPERRGASIATMAVSRRPELVAQYTTVIQRLLQQQFPAAAGYEHSLDWRVASCVNPRRHSLDVQRACRATSIKITRGRDWGIVITTTPADIDFKNFKVIVSGAVPFVEGLQGWIIKIASFIGLAVGLVVFGIWIWLHPEQGPKRTLLLGALFGVTLFLVLVFIGLLLLSPLRAIFSSYRMKEPVASGINVIEQAWAEVQSSSPGLPSLARRRSPAFVYACWLVISLVAGALCLLLPNWPTLPTEAIVVLGLVLAVAGFAALGMLLGIIVSLFGLMKE